MSKTKYSHWFYSLILDVCLINTTNSILQQASHLTNGICVVCDQKDLLHHLFYLFLADSESRKAFKKPRIDSIDYRATCFCHQRHVNMGHVCSVCLAVFCKSLDTCCACKSIMTI